MKKVLLVMGLAISTMSFGQKKSDKFVSGTVSYTKSTGADTGKKATTASIPSKSITNYIQFMQPYQDEKGNVVYQGATAMVAVKDTTLVRTYLTEFSNNFPSDVIWAFGVADKDSKGVSASILPLYALKTYNRTAAKLEGDAISNARQDFDQYGKHAAVYLHGHGYCARSRSCKWNHVVLQHGHPS